MHKREDFHNTPQQVDEALEQAIVLLNHHELTEGERENLLPTLVVLLTNKQIFYEQVGALPGLALPPNARH